MKKRTKATWNRSALAVAATAALALAGCGGSDGGSASDAPLPGPDLHGSDKPAVQGVTRIVINEAASQAATFGGTSFGPYGTYDRVVGKAYGQLDPKDPKNAVITDIQLAQRDPATGLVPYSFDFYILKPTNPQDGAHKVFYEPPNRGGKVFSSFAGVGGGDNPGAGGAADAAPVGAALPAFLMNRGYTMVWSGWDAEPMSGTGKIRANLPLAVNPDGSPITGPSYEYLVAGNATTTCQTTYYSPAPNTSATLTVREHMTDSPVVVPADAWSWGGAGSCGNTPEVSVAGTNSVNLNGQAFKPGSIYELNFTAINPYVAGVGMAAMRDFVTFLRQDKKDTEGNANPLNAKVTTITTWALSQPARLMNDFIWLGFNQDLRGKQVFDGVFNWIGGGNGLGINYRFAQVGRTERNRQNHIAQTEGTFPFSYTTSTDPLTGKTDGKNVRCTASKTCPNVMNVYSANELWVKSGSLLTTDPATGLDLPEVANVRNYLVASAQHGNASSTTAAPASCTQFGSQVDPDPVLRALWVALDNWTGKQIAPPASANPSLNAGTAARVPAGSPLQSLGIGTISASAIGYPELPASINQFSGLVTVRNLWDFGSRFDSGILDTVPGRYTGKLYPTLVPKVDANGNDLAGIRTPDITVPLGTNSGWALRSASFAGKSDGTDGCEASGQFVPFALTDAAKVAGDPRPSLQSLYGDKAGFIAARAAAAQALQAKGLLLPEDATNYRVKAEKGARIVPNPNYPNAYVYNF